MNLRRTEQINSPDIYSLANIEEKMTTVNIIGAGLAGLSAAITLAKQNITCNLISLQASERAQSILAAGGINAVLNTMGEDDTVGEHFRDTMRGGVDLADPNAVQGLVHAAPEIVRELYRLGVPLQAENGKLIQRNFGGQKKKRTAYSKSSTGKMLMSALIDEARRLEAQGRIHRYPHHEFLDLLLASDEKSLQCTGCLLRDTYTGELLQMRGPVILASGGMNGIFGSHTTGTTQNTGDVTATVFARGVQIGNPEFIQYHPTTIAIPGKRMLISEAARGEGGRLFVIREGKPWYFMEEKYPELGNLMPRDVISREMDRVSRDPSCEPQIYLNLTCIPDETWKKKLSDMREECIHYLHIDPVKEPLPVEPGIHYFMGGILVDQEHRTSLPGLYAAGECACQYHGANRLGGNSMLGAIYGGRVAAQTVSSEINTFTEWEDSDGKAYHPENDVASCYPEPRLDDQKFAEVEQKRIEALMRGLAICRTGEGIRKELLTMDELLQTEALSERMRKRLLLSKAILLGADKREESRGAHYRLDFPEKSEDFRKTTVVVCAGTYSAIRIIETAKTDEKEVRDFETKDRQFRTIPADGHLRD